MHRNYSVKPISATVACRLLGVLTGATFLIRAAANEVDDIWDVAQRDTNVPPPPAAVSPPPSSSTRFHVNQVASNIVAQLTATHCARFIRIVALGAAASRVAVDEYDGVAELVLRCALFDVSYHQRRRKLVDDDREDVSSPGTADTASRVQRRAAYYLVLLQQHGCSPHAAEHVRSLSWAEPENTDLLGEVLSKLCARWSEQAAAALRDTVVAREGLDFGSSQFQLWCTRRIAEAVVNRLFGTYSSAEATFSFQPANVIGLPPSLVFRLMSGLFPADDLAALLVSEYEDATVTSDQHSGDVAPSTAAPFFSSPLQRKKSLRLSATTVQKNASMKIQSSPLRNTNAVQRCAVREFNKHVDSVSDPRDLLSVAASSFGVGSSGVERMLPLLHPYTDWLSAASYLLAAPGFGPAVIPRGDTLATSAGVLNTYHNCLTEQTQSALGSRYQRADRMQLLASPLADVNVTISAATESWSSWLLCNRAAHYTYVMAMCQHDEEPRSMPLENSTALHELVEQLQQQCTSVFEHERASSFSSSSSFMSVRSFARFCSILCVPSLLSSSSLADTNADPLTCFCGTTNDAALRYMDEIFLKLIFSPDTPRWIAEDPTGVHCLRMLDIAPGPQSMSHVRTRGERCSGEVSADELLQAVKPVGTSGDALQQDTLLFQRHVESALVRIKQKQKIATVGVPTDSAAEAQNEREAVEAAWKQVSSDSDACSRDLRGTCLRRAHSMRLGLTVADLLVLSCAWSLVHSQLRQPSHVALPAIAERNLTLQRSALAIRRPVTNHYIHAANHTVVLASHRCTQQRAQLSLSLRSSLAEAADSATLLTNEKVAPLLACLKGVAPAPQDLQEKWGADTWLVFQHLTRRSTATAAAAEAPPPMKSRCGALSGSIYIAQRFADGLGNALGNFDVANTFVDHVSTRSLHLRLQTAAIDRAAQFVSRLEATRRRHRHLISPAHDDAWRTPELVRRHVVESLAWSCRLPSQLGAIATALHIPVKYATRLTKFMQQNNNLGDSALPSLAALLPVVGPAVSGGGSLHHAATHQDVTTMNAFVPAGVSEAVGMLDACTALLDDLVTSSQERLLHIGEKLRRSIAALKVAPRQWYVYEDAKAADEHRERQRALAALAKAREAFVQRTLPTMVSRSGLTTQTTRAALLARLRSIPLGKRSDDATTAQPDELRELALGLETLREASERFTSATEKRDAVTKERARVAEVKTEVLALRAQLLEELDAKKAAAAAQVEKRLEFLQTQLDDEAVAIEQRARLERTVLQQRIASLEERSTWIRQDADGYRQNLLSEHQRRVNDLILEKERLVALQAEVETAQDLLSNSLIGQWNSPPPRGGKLRARRYLPIATLRPTIASTSDTERSPPRIVGWSIVGEEADGEELQGGAAALQKSAARDVKVRFWCNERNAFAPRTVDYSVRVSPAL